MIKSLILETSSKDEPNEIILGSSYANNVEVIKIKKTKSYKIIRTIYGKPSPGSLGDYWLLKDEYSRMDPTWISENPDQWRRLNFNDQYMNHMLDNFGELHCEYCG